MKDNIQKNMYVITKVSRNEAASYGSLFLALITTKDTFCVCVFFLGPIMHKKDNQ